jgi:putative DNA modification/repair radical SAM protein
MDRNAKLRILADSAKYDASCASSGSVRSNDGRGIGHSDGMGICHSYTPDGRCVSLLKILLTNHCVYDCVFCVNRASSDVPRARFTPDEVVELTLDFYRRNYIEGLFLSSGIFVSPDRTMEDMVRTARLLRETHRFGGYIHLKTIPGAAKELIEAAGRLADRVSVNIELPTQKDLDQFAPEKRSAVIETAMGQIQERVLEAREQGRSRHAPAFAPAGQTTQMVIGATPSTDRQILATASRLYAGFQLRRIYYSGFSPYPHADARLPIHPPPLVREHRLYQADWLMRYYGFNGYELTTELDENLNLARDPKLQWALRHREFYPVDINTAEREALLRVPGLGYKNVARVLAIRRYHRLTLVDLAKLRVPLRRLKSFVITADSPAHALRVDSLDLGDQVTTHEQLALFDAAVEACSGQI